MAFCLSSSLVTLCNADIMLLQIDITVCLHSSKLLKTLLTSLKSYPNFKKNASVLHEWSNFGQKWSNSAFFALFIKEQQNKQNKILLYYYKNTRRVLYYILLLFY